MYMSQKIGEFIRPVSIDLARASSNAFISGASQAGFGVLNEIHNVVKKYKAERYRPISSISYTNYSIDTCYKEAKLILSSYKKFLKICNR